MSDPIAFPSSTSVLGLPLLIAGQAQKEFFVNQALSMLDALHAQAVTASQAAPPATPAEGSCYRVTANPTGAWSGHQDHIALRIGGEWRFIAPVEGLLLYDRTASRMMVFRSQWHPAPAPALPSGGTVVDTEARAAVTALVEGLRTLGVFGTPAA